MCPQNSQTTAEGNNEDPHFGGTEYGLADLFGILKIIIYRFFCYTNLSLTANATKLWIQENPWKALQVGMVLLVVSGPVLLFVAVITASFIFTAFSFFLLQGMIVLGAVLGLLGSLLVLGTCLGLPLLFLSVAMGSGSWLPGLAEQNIRHVHHLARAWLRRLRTALQSVRHAD